MTDQITFQNRDGRLTVFLSGEIDHHAAAFLRMQIDHQIGLNRPELLCLDFRRVGLMDSSGIGLILGRYRKMGGSGGSVELSGLSPRLKTTVKLAGLPADIRIMEAEE